MAIKSGKDAYWTAKRGIVQDGLVLNLDAAVSDSYPGYGTTWKDLSGRNNHGTLANGPTFNSEKGGSLVFDGSDDFVSGSNVSIANTPFTISSWIKTGSISSNKIFFSIGTVAGTRTAIHLRFASSTTSFRFGLFSDDLDVTLSNTSSNFTNLVCVLNSSYLQSIYQNASFIGSRTAGGFYTGNNSFNFGKWILGAEYWNGNIAQSLIYNRALSQAEITQNYNATKKRFGL